MKNLFVMLFFLCLFGCEQVVDEPGREPIDPVFTAQGPGGYATLTGEVKGTGRPITPEDRVVLDVYASNDYRTPLARLSIPGDGKVIVNGLPFTGDMDVILHGSSVLPWKGVVNAPLASEPRTAGTLETTIGYVSLVFSESYPVSAGARFSVGTKYDVNRDALDSLLAGFDSAVTDTKVVLPPSGVFPGARFYEVTSRSPQNLKSVFDSLVFEEIIRGVSLEADIPHLLPFQPYFADSISGMGVK